VTDRLKRRSNFDAQQRRITDRPRSKIKVAEIATSMRVSEGANDMNKRTGWNHTKNTTARGYGAEHQRMRAYLKATVITCEHCASASPPRTRLGCVADHIVSLAKGGSSERSNYAWLCGECADIKDAQDRGKPLRHRPQVGLDGWPKGGGGMSILSLPDRCGLEHSCKVPRLVPRVKGQ
jgi:5-methylcytosine-specific restriction protein A